MGKLDAQCLVLQRLAPAEPCLLLGPPPPTWFHTIDRCSSSSSLNQCTARSRRGVHQPLQLPITRQRRCGRTTPPQDPFAAAETTRRAACKHRSQTRSPRPSPAPKSSSPDPLARCSVQPQLAFASRAATGCGSSSTSRHFTKLRPRPDGREARRRRPPARHRTRAGSASRPILPRGR